MGWWQHPQTPVQSSSMTGWYHREHYSVVQEPYLSTDPQTWSIQDHVKLRLPAVIEVAATCQFLASHCGVPGGGSKPGKLLIKNKTSDTTFLTRRLRTSTSNLRFATVLGHGHHIFDEMVAHEHIKFAFRYSFGWWTPTFWTRRLKAYAVAIPFLVLLLTSHMLTAKAPDDTTLSQWIHILARKSFLSLYRSERFTVGLQAISSALT